MTDHVLHQEGLFADTRPEIEALLVEGFARMSPEEKLRRVSAMTKAVQQLALVRIQGQHPDADERELHLRLASLWLDRGTMVRVFGWDPEQEGY